MPAGVSPFAAGIGRILIVAVLAAGLLLLAPAAVVSAGETVIQNDSVIDFGDVAIQVGFAADERAASWLTATCDGDLIAIRVLWLSFLGGQPDIIHQAVTVWQPGAFPMPGPVEVQLLGPVMSDGFFNDFQLVPPIPVNMGDTVVLGFQFLNAPPALGPSLVTDTNGCQSGRNGILAIPPNSWFDACALGVSGDFAIRGVLDCPIPIFVDGFESGDTMAWSSSAP